MRWRRRRIGAAGIAAVALLAMAAQAGAVTAQSTITTAFGSGVPGSAPDGSTVSGPRGVTVVPILSTTLGEQAVVVADTGNGRILGGLSPAGLLMPSDILSGGQRGATVSDTGHHRIVGQLHPIAPNGPSTIAGTGVAAFSGDGGPADQAQLSSPGGIASGPSGLYVADTGNNRIRLIGTDPKTFVSTISTTAGNGDASFSGDGGPAAAAALNAPLDVIADAQGTLYIADTGNNRVRRVALDGVITTIAGTGAAGFAGDGGPAVGAQLNAPSGLAVDAVGNLYISDTGNHRIRRVAPDGTITTVAGSDAAAGVGDGGPAGAARLVSPRGLVVDDKGNLYVADEGDHRVRKITNTRPIGALTATFQTAAAPVEVTFDASGITDPDGRVVSYRWLEEGQNGSPTPDPRLTRVFTTPGKHSVTVEVVDDTGGVALMSADVTVTPEIVPDGLTLTSAQIGGRWEASRLLGGQLAIAGEVVRGARLRLTLLQRGRAVAATTFSATAGGPFVRIVKLRPRIRPGGYTVRLAQVGNRASAPLPTREIGAFLFAPAEGVASQAAVGRARSGLVARFAFLSRPRAGAALAVRWFAPGGRRPAAVHRVSVRNVVLDRLPLPAGAPPGVWRAELRWGLRLVATATTRVRA